MLNMKTKLKSAVPFIIILFLISSCETSGNNSSSVTEPEISYLKDLAAARGITIGSLYNYGYSNPIYVNYLTYNDVLKSEFSMMSLEWEFAMDEIWTSESVYDYTYLDHALQYAYDNNISVRGTHIFWHANIPSWLESGAYDSVTVQSLVQAYITALFNHIQTNFPGVMTEVNVVNEVIRDDWDTDTTYNELRNTFWVQKLGTNYIENAFNWTKTAFPSAKLFINDYGTEFQGAKQIRLTNLLAALQTASVPVDGVGLQAHFSIHDIMEDPFDPALFSTALNIYKTMGFEIAITEMDVRINDDQTGITDAKLLDQAARFKQVVQLSLENSAVKSISLWGFNDDLSYLNGSAAWLPQTRDWGLIFDADFIKKPAYYSITEALLF
jgi:endo-1,4-beta-xylanase